MGNCTRLITPFGQGDSGNLQRAIDEMSYGTDDTLMAGNKGGTLCVAEEVFQIDAPLVLNEGVRLGGSGSLEGRVWGPAGPMRGTWFSVTFGDGSITGAPAIEMRAGTTIENPRFFYPAQKTNLALDALLDAPPPYPPDETGVRFPVPGPNSPTPFPPTVKIYDGADARFAAPTRIEIRDCFFRHIAIDAWHVRGAHGGLHLHNCYSFPLFVGVAVSGSTDVDTLDRVYAPRGMEQSESRSPGQRDRSRPAPAVDPTAWNQFLIGRADNLAMAQCGCFGYGMGVWSRPAKATVFRGFWGSGILTDSSFDCCRQPLRIDGANALRVSKSWFVEKGLFRRSRSDTIGPAPEVRRLRGSIDHRGSIHLRFPGRG